jgi:hypothetical protein
MRTQAVTQAEVVPMTGLTNADMSRNASRCRADDRPDTCGLMTGAGMRCVAAFNPLIVNKKQTWFAKNVKKTYLCHPQLKNGGVWRV